MRITIRTLLGEAELNDELKKSGLGIQSHIVGEPRAEKPGRIAFDDRGNAVYQWSNDRLSENGEDGERLRHKALEHPALSLADEEPAGNVPIHSNPKGLRVGYNPYESGVLAKQVWNKKRDLRKLSNWLEMKRKLNGQLPDKG